MKSFEKCFSFFSSRVHKSACYHKVKHCLLLVAPPFNGNISGELLVRFHAVLLTCPLTHTTARDVSSLPETNYRMFMSHTNSRYSPCSGVKMQTPSKTDIILPLSPYSRPGGCPWWSWMGPSPWWAPLSSLSWYLKKGFYQCVSVKINNINSVISFSPLHVLVISSHKIIVNRSRIMQSD